MSSSRNKKDDDFGFDEDEAMPGSASIIEVEEESPKATQITKRQQASGENSAGPALATSSDPHYFDINPMRKTCQFCSIEVVTYVEHEVNPFFGLAALITMIVLGFLSFIILPIAYLLTMNAVHRCSRCLNRIGEKQCFGLPDNFQEEIWHFKLGKCSIVMARLYAIIGIVLIAGLSGFYVYQRPSYMIRDNPLFHHNIESKTIDEQWIDYLADCGGEQVIENYVHAKMTFNEKYENNLVTWEGYYAEIKQKQMPVFSFWGNDHQLSLLIKMEPSESAIFADLVLSVSSEVYNQRRELFDNLQKGQQIKFEATLVGLGNEFKMHHLHAKNVWPTGLFQEIDEIVVRESSLP